MQQGDTYFVLLLLAVFTIWGWLVFRRRFRNFWHNTPVMGERVGTMPQDVIDFLEFAGYEVVDGKHKVPITIEAEGDYFETRLFIDGFAKLDDELYIIRIARERRPMEWTGSSIRDHLLPIYLLNRHAAGVLYVDPRQRLVKPIKFELDA